MSASASLIENQALALQLPERARLVLKLLDSIEARSAQSSATAQAAWLAEANRRFEAYQRGEEAAMDAAHVFADLERAAH